MSSYVLFLLLGLGAGAVYGMLALGLVLKHRSAGVVDFGHGAVAMFIAYVYLGLRYLSQPQREHRVDRARAEAEEEEEDVGGHGNGGRGRAQRGARAPFLVSLRRRQL